MKTATLLFVGVLFSITIALVVAYPQKPEPRGEFQVDVPLRAQRTPTPVYLTREQAESALRQLVGELGNGGPLHVPCPGDNVNDKGQGQPGAQLPNEARTQPAGTTTVWVDSSGVFSYGPTRFKIEPSQRHGAAYKVTITQLEK